MSEPANTPETDEKNAHKPHASLIHRLDLSAVLTMVGVIFLFSFSIIVTLIAPRYIDSTWTSPSSPFQVQMYEVEDPNLYISSVATGGKELQYVHHVKDNFTLLAFKESDHLRILAPSELESFITKENDKELKLTSRLLFLREPEDAMKTKAEELRKSLRGAEKKPNENKLEDVHYEILELYDPGLKEAFAFDPNGGIIPNWVDKDFNIIGNIPSHLYQSNYGVVYVLNPTEFRIGFISYGGEKRWRYQQDGRRIENVSELRRPELGFYSRQELISIGEHIYAIEGCWYCHTDQTRTLIQDTVSNGSDSFPAPPSSANEYIYQKITFPGTRRIGPDLSRTGVKRPSRDWHKSHFWAPKTASVGSIMPAFQHFFDNDPRGTGKNMVAVPNYRFEAIYQYLMTKGTRITSPTQAWWLGKDPVQTIEIIEGQRKLP